MAKKSIKIEVESDQYDELVPEDEANDTIPKSSCALWSIFLFLILFLALIIGSLFCLKTKNFSFKTSKTNQNVNSIVVPPTPIGEEVTLRLTEDQIQKAINADDVNFPIKKSTVKVNTDKIILSGKTSNSFWGINVEVGIVPKVEEGKVVFNITEIKSAGVIAPKSISDLINNNLGQYLDGLSSSVGNIEVSAVTLNTGFMTVMGKQK